MQLPPAEDLRQAFHERGFVLVPDFLEPHGSADLAALATAVTARFGLHIHRPSGDGTLDYRVVTGDVIRTEAGPIYALYESSDLLTWIRGVTMTEKVSRSPHLRSAVNINRLDTSGQQYLWHNDAVPFTVLLFLTTLPDSAGGEFLIRTGSEQVATIRPAAGHLLLMDGQQCMHAVAPLRENVLRLTVPMVFPAVQTERPPGLDDFIYSVG